VTQDERIGVEILEALESIRVRNGYCSAAKLEKWVRDRFDMRRKKCKGCGKWLPLDNFTAATGYRFNRAPKCAVCVRNETLYPPGCEPR
jgi:hypothetical protein